MKYVVLPVNQRPPESAVGPCTYLIEDNWNDYWQFRTLYDVIYLDRAGKRHSLGQAKIGQFNMASDQDRPDLPEDFSVLGDQFFSLGQDDTYYQKLKELGADVRDDILRSLRDVAFDDELFERALQEDVTGVSLLRYISRATVVGQFRRLARGGKRLTHYDFSYAPPPRTHATETVELDFAVTPKSQPPTNIHVLIGRNGVGKTTLLNHMTRALADDRATAEEAGVFTTRGSQRSAEGFANLVSVSFSAFDDFEPISNSRNKADGMQYAYIGLKKIRTTTDKDKSHTPKDRAALAREFSLSVQACLQGARQVRWRRALEMLEADPIFNDAGVADLADAATDGDQLREQAQQLFKRLSSGHKIVLLTMTRLVESVQERSLVLLDEPEAHLHPPLLSAFTRALSDLLIDRNGVAIIATHSPVVLQEVPRTCAWKLRRSGYEVAVERPEIETFGENVGVLTREIFGLEVTRSGFHRLLDKAISQGTTYEQIVEQFGGQLGGEARALVRALLAAQEEEDV
ncbi:AAA family ATPase [Streptomyces sp. NPDC001893]|uniref:AAA family ATPase n=1 Tax=Streptomyces sp. NPDC001893 TaxID=3154530 RepID=UPI003325137D